MKSYRLLVTLTSFLATFSVTGLPSTVFWNNDFPSDTVGELQGTVLFAQGQIFPSKNGVHNDNMQPHVTALRKTLVMFKPSASDTTVYMTVKDVDGNVLALNIEMKDPENIPKQDGWMPGVSPGLTFPETLTNHYVIQGKSNLDQTNDPAATFITDKLNNENHLVQVKYWDGSWASDLYLPDATTVPSNSVVWVTSNAGYNVRVNYPNTITGGWRTATLSRGTEAMLVVNDGSYWIQESDLEHNDYVFGHGFWTAILEAPWVKPGMTLEFNRGENSGILSDIDVGGETELIISAIDAGFLTPPRGAFGFKDDEATHREYFQTTPASRLIVVQYETLHLTEVMLPSGVLYTTSSTDEGGWHSGDMRQYTGKILISHGTDLANYGINSSSGTSESSHPFTCAFLAAHNTVGQYTNGRVVHGGSGGNGIITLDSSIGNEMSHEAGHNYGLGHYVGGFDGSVHKAANEVGSTWGYDSDLNVFIPNFFSSTTNQDQCCCPGNSDDQCESPFMSRYKFGKDSMAGGSAGHWGSNRFTLYTPNTYKTVQSFLESKLLWDSKSSTGYMKYNPVNHQMEEAPNPNNDKRPISFGVPVTTLIGYYDPDGELQDYIYPALHGAYGFVYEADAFSDSDNVGCKLLVETVNAGLLVYELSSSRFTANNMNKFHVNIATADEATNAEVKCNGVSQVTKSLDGPQTELRYTVNGYDSKIVDPSPTPSQPVSVAPSTPLVPTTIVPIQSSFPSAPMLVTEPEPTPVSEPPENGNGDCSKLFFATFKVLGHL